MKATLKFNLPEERYEYACAIQACAMQAALHKIVNDVLPTLENNADSEYEAETILKVRKAINNIVNPVKSSGII